MKKFLFFLIFSSFFCLSIGISKAILITPSRPLLRGERFNIEAQVRYGVSLEPVSGANVTYSIIDETQSCFVDARYEYNLTENKTGIYCSGINCDVDEQDPKAPFAPGTYIICVKAEKEGFKTAYENTTILVSSQGCALPPFVVSGRLRFNVSCIGEYYSFGNTKKTFSLPILVELDAFKLLFDSPLVHWMIGLGNGSLDDYGRPNNSIALEFESDSSLKIVKILNGVETELDSIPINPSQTHWKIQIFLNETHAGFWIDGLNKFYSVDFSIDSWYFFSNAYNSSLVGEIDNAYIIKHSIPEPLIFFGEEVEHMLERMRLGLNSEKFNQTNVLSLEKIQKLNELCSRDYSSVKQKLGCKYDFSLLIINKTSSPQLLLDCHPSKRERVGLNFTIRRIASLENGDVVELIFSVW